MSLCFSQFHSQIHVSTNNLVDFFETVNWLKGDFYLDYIRYTGLGETFEIDTTTPTPHNKVKVVNRMWDEDEEDLNGIVSHHLIATLLG